MGSSGRSSLGQAGSLYRIYDFSNFLGDWFLAANRLTALADSTTAKADLRPKPTFSRSSDIGSFA